MGRGRGRRGKREKRNGKEGEEVKEKGREKRILGCRDYYESEMKNKILKRIYRACD